MFYDAFGFRLNKDGVSRIAEPVNSGVPDEKGTIYWHPKFSRRELNAASQALPESVKEQLNQPSTIYNTDSSSHDRKQIWDAVTRSLMLM